MDAPAAQAFGPAVLFCPADRPDRFAKALAAADTVVVDLEDGVGPEHKEQARRAVEEYADRLPPARTVVRINPLGTAWADDDLALLRRTRLRQVMVPKAIDAAAIARLAPLRVVALCETAAGVLAAAELAAVENCVALFWGAEDLAADIGGRSSRRRDGSYLPVATHARAHVLLAAAAHGKPAWDAVHLDIDDLPGLARETTDAVDMGFAAKVVIHPSHVPVVRRAFAPSAEQVAWAREVLAAAGPSAGALRVSGRMVDAPLVAQARTILARGGGPTAEDEAPDDGGDRHHHAR